MKKTIWSGQCHIAVRDIGIDPCIAMGCDNPRERTLAPLAPGRTPGQSAEMDAQTPGLTTAELQDLSRKRDGPGLLRLALQLAVLSVTGTLILSAEDPWVLVPSLVVHGIVLIFLFCPLHESVHRTAFKTRWLNRVAGWLGGAVMILPPKFFSHFHFAHHRHTQIPGEDPELLSRKPTDWSSFVYVMSGMEYWRRAILGLLSRAAGNIDSTFTPEPQRPRVVLESRIFLAGYAAAIAWSIWAGSDLILWLWVYPALIGQPFLRGYLLAEHWGCPTVKDMWTNTRSTVSNPLVRWLAWNMPYHAEHHAHAGVPFHALPALSRRMEAARQVVSPGYLPFHLREVPDLVRKGEGFNGPALLYPANKCALPPAAVVSMQR